MPRLIILAILTAVVAFGATILYQRYQGARPNYLIAAHLVTGFGALGALVYYLKDLDNGDGLPPASFGHAAVGLLGAAAFSGLLAPVVGRRSSGYGNYLIIAHVVCGLTGVAVAYLWVLNI